MNNLFASSDIVKYQKRLRVGRGIGSGSGKTCGRGHKGDGSRSGSKSRRGHEGGQKPIFRKVAKRGFNQRGFSDDAIVVSTDQLVAICNDQGVCDLILASGLRGARRVEVRVVLGRHSLSAMDVVANYFSAGAEAGIASAGGRCVRV